MGFLDKTEWPLTAKAIAQHCGVTTRTAQRWLSGRTQAPASARRLVQLIQRGRIMPETWPAQYRINHAGALDVGFTKVALTPAQIEWYFVSCHYWHLLLDLIPAIEQRITELETHPGAIVIELEKYRATLRTMKARQFLLYAYK